MWESTCLKNVQQLVFSLIMWETINTTNPIATHTTLDGVIIQTSFSFSTPNCAVATQQNNQLENILKSIIQETSNQFQAQGVSIKSLESQDSHIAYALSSRPMGALPSSTEAPSPTFGTKSIETCKIILLRSEKEYEGPSRQNTKHLRKDLKT